MAGEATAPLLGLVLVLGALPLVLRRTEALARGLAGQGAALAVLAAWPGVTLGAPGPLVAALLLLAGPGIGVPLGLRRLVAVGRLPAVLPPTWGLAPVLGLALVVLAMLGLPAPLQAGLGPGLGAMALGLLAAACRPGAAGGFLGLCGLANGAAAALLGLPGLPGLAVFIAALMVLMAAGLGGLALLLRHLPRVA